MRAPYDDRINADVRERDQSTERASERYTRPGRTSAAGIAALTGPQTTVHHAPYRAGQLAALIPSIIAYRFVEAKDEVTHCTPEVMLY